jgi:hypothetical protein
MAPGQSAQPTLAAFDRRYIVKPIPANPISSIAHPMLRVRIRQELTRLSKPGINSLVASS